ncbi:MAG: hypothetical protein AAF328_04905 [Planctomycetota bacterium]
MCVRFGIKPVWWWRVALALALGSTAGASSAEPALTSDHGDRAAIRHAFVDANDEPRIGAWWWDERSSAWSAAPDASWSAVVPNDDARFRWIEAVSVRHVAMPGRGRLAFVLDAGDAWPVNKAAVAQDSHDFRLGAAKLVAMSGLTGKVVDAWWFDVGHEVFTESRLRDVVIDPTTGVAVIHDAGTAGLLVVDLWSRRAHRALDGYVLGDAVLTLDPAGGWLSWRAPGEPVGGRVPWAELLDARLDPAALSHLVEPTVWRGWVPPNVADDVIAARCASLPTDATAFALALRWSQAGASRSLAGDASLSVLRREAARGLTATALEHTLAQEP